MAKKKPTDRSKNLRAVQKHNEKRKNQIRELKKEKAEYLLIVKRKLENCLYLRQKFRLELRAENREIKKKIESNQINALVIWLRKPSANWLPRKSAASWQDIEELITKKNF